MAELDGRYIDAVEAVTNAANAQIAMDACHAYLHNYGFNSINYVHGNIVADEKRLNNLRIDGLVSPLSSSGDSPQEFFDHYNEQQYFNDDPHVLPFHRGNRLPFLVGLGVPQADNNTNPRRTEILEEYRHGPGATTLNLPMMTPFSSKLPTAGINLRSRLPYAKLKLHLARLGNRAEFLAHLANDAILPQLRMLHEGIDPLSARERECLQWIASGLRPVQIAERLGVSLHTVDFHLRGARAKLKTNSVAHSVAKALSCSQITL